MGLTGYNGMFNTEKLLHENDEKREINMTPLLDLVFILLIFFLVTSSFVKESGVTVDKASAATAQALEQNSVMVAITASNEIHIAGERVSLIALRAKVRNELRRTPDKPVVVIADRESRNATLVDVMDECKLAGATKISLATERE